jgi:hypothetical protein
MHGQYGGCLLQLQIRISVNVNMATGHHLERDLSSLSDKRENTAFPLQESALTFTVTLDEWVLEPAWAAKTLKQLQFTATDRFL